MKYNARRPLGDLDSAATEDRSHPIEVNRKRQQPRGRESISSSCVKLRWRSARSVGFFVAVFTAFFPRLARGEIITVKLAPETTPEQQCCARDIDQALGIFWHLVERIRNAAEEQQPIHQVEEIIFRDALTMGRALLRSFLAASGDGDVGPTLTIPGERPDEPPQVLPRLDEPRSRPYLSIFGEVTIERVGYGEDRLDAAPLDARLHLPRRQYSHLLQRWLGAFVIDDAHAEAVRKLGMILGITTPVKASEDLNREQASDVEPFQDRLPVPEPSQEGSIVVVTADCKGVPLIRSALAAAESEEEAQGTATSSEPHHRRGKGEKANKKRMAAVGAVYTIDPFVRTTDEVIDELQRKKAGKRRPRPRAQASPSRPAAGEGHAVPLAGR